MIPHGVLCVIKHRYYNSWRQHPTFGETNILSCGFRVGKYNIYILFIY